LCILTFPSDEHYDTSLCETGHLFYGIKIPEAKGWNTLYPIPKNYRMMVTANNQVTLPLYQDFDVIIAHDRVLQYQVANQLAQEYNLPLVLVEHANPLDEWTESRVLPLRNREGKVNVFVSEGQRATWGFEPDYDCTVNYIGIDHKRFAPSEVKREDYVLWMGNHIMHKDEVYGFPIMRYITGFPMPMVRLKILGDNTNISRPPKDIAELVEAYSKAGVYLNTKPNDPLPTSMLEAMACGCPVVSIAVGDIPKVIKHGETGFYSKDLDALKGYIGQLLTDKELAAKIGTNARELIKRKFGVARFIKAWQDILNKALEE